LTYIFAPQTNTEKQDIFAAVPSGLDSRFHGNDKRFHKSTETVVPSSSFLCKKQKVGRLIPPSFYVIKGLFILG
jgi:hypothetical protein